MTLDDLGKYVGARFAELVSIGIYQDEHIEGNTDDFPYLVYKFPSSSNEVRNRTDWICEVDFWDNQNVKTNIRQSADLVRAGFDYYYQTEAEGFYHSYIIFYGVIPTDSPQLSRIQQRYILKVR